MNPQEKPPSPVSEDPPKSPPPMDDTMLRGEQCLSLVHRHVIGIVALYLQVIIGVLAVAAIMFLGIPTWLGHTSTQTNSLIVAGTIFAIAILVFVLLVGTYVYRQTRLIVTESSIILVLQSGLFGRKVSRLSMSNVEDVTAISNGLLPTLFGYGVLNVETAGEQENFSFTYCPNPNVYAQRILKARQDYANRVGGKDG